MNKQEANSREYKLRVKKSALTQKIIKIDTMLKLLKEIIDAPEPKTGRVMSADDLGETDKFYKMNGQSAFYMDHKVNWDLDALEALVRVGFLFHDKASCEQYIEYLKLEQELRIAQIADGGTGGEHVLGYDLTQEILKYYPGIYTQKVSFNTKAALNIFRESHSPEELELLIRGV